MPYLATLLSQDDNYPLNPSKLDVDPIFNKIRQSIRQINQTSPTIGHSVLLSYSNMRLLVQYRHGWGTVSGRMTGPTHKRHRKSDEEEQGGVAFVASSTVVCKFIKRKQLPTK